MPSTTAVTDMSAPNCHQSILRAMLRGFMTVAGLTLVAKALSFLKDATVANAFGITATLDAFVIAFGIHSTICALLGGGLPESFLPAYAELKARRPGARAERLGVQSVMLQLGMLLLVCVILWLFSGPLIGLMARGGLRQTRALAQQMLLELIPFLLCYGCSSVLNSWLRAGKRFMLASSAPLIIPLTMILGLFIQGKEATVHTLVWTTNLGAALHFLTLAFGIARSLPLKRRGWLVSCLRHWETTVWRIVANSGPYILASAILGSGVLIDQTMAGWLKPGSVSLLSYTEKISGMILALTAIAATETLFPFYADAVAKRDWPALRKQLLHTIGVVLLLAVPAVVLLLWQAPMIVKLMFQRGAFMAEDTLEVAHVLRFSALQIPFYIIGILLSKVVVSLQSRWFSLSLALVAMTINICLNWMFMQHMGVAGIALSTAVVNLCCAVALVTYVTRRLKVEETTTREMQS
jgi:putative peptidoglycan lipid II flippase